MKFEKHLKDSADLSFLIKILVGIIILPFLLMYWLYKILKWFYER